MTLAEIVLKYLKVLLSPQMSAGIVIVLFLCVFREPLKELIFRIAKIRLPGGSEMLLSQAERSKEETSSREELPPEPTKLDADSLSLPPEGLKQVVAAFDSERARAAFWEYEYLNLYLVPNTQKVLGWLSALSQPVTRSFFDSLWSPIIPIALERAAILRALENHHLVVLNQADLIEVTEKGREYLLVRRPRTDLST